VDPESPSREPNPEEAWAIRNEAAERFGIAEAAYEFHGCLYTNTSDEDFLFGRHRENGFFCSACSGHGFKFGPWMGNKLADFIEERDAPENHPRFCWPKPKLEA
jgi:sarcosine oxidase